jgi:hypothetical protein
MSCVDDRAIQYLVYVKEGVICVRQSNAIFISKDTYTDTNIPVPDKRLNHRQPKMQYQSSHKSS